MHILSGAGIGVAVVTWALLMWFVMDLNDRDMRVCQLTYSHDTCFSALNR